MIKKTNGTLLIINVVIGLGISCLPGTASAWNFNEHWKLGENSFSRACNLLEKNISNSEERDLVYAIACRDIAKQARIYGLRSGLSGDHIEAPENFLHVDAEIEALSWQNYGSLAIRNFEHFWPYVMTTWRKHHEEALEFAQAAGKHWHDNRKDLAVTEFEKALIYSAFADHFLQDAFSIGHNGFARIESLQNSSLIFHDYWNKRGRRLKRTSYDVDLATAIADRDKLKKVIQASPAKTEIWMAYGDGQITDDNKLNDENYEKIVKANTESILSVLLAFIEGNGSDFYMLADRDFPQATENFSMQDIFIGGELFRLNPEYIYSSEFKKVREEIYMKDSARVGAENGCNGKNPQIYEEHNTCWFNLDQAYMEPVFQAASLGFTHTNFFKQNLVANGLYFSYNLNAWKATPLWARNYSIYLNGSTGSTYENNVTNDILYYEAGIGGSLPNFFYRTNFSLSYSLGYANMRYYDKDYNAYLDQVSGYVAGVNGNYDFMRWKMVMGLGAFIPASTPEHIPEYKFQLMLVYSSSVIGGGPLKRWDNQ